uniref:Uncharacterized protein n=1 Tax=Oryza nivara TaxID=4536 RepID=A0A0E0J0H9_ORYNI
MRWRQGVATCRQRRGGVRVSLRAGSGGGACSAFGRVVPNFVVSDITREESVDHVSTWPPVAEVDRRRMQERSGRLITYGCLA